MADPNKPTPPKRRGRPTSSGRNQPTKIVGDKGHADMDDMIDDLEKRITNIENSYEDQKKKNSQLMIKKYEIMSNEVKARYGEDHKKITSEFLDNVLNRTKKELMVNKGKRIEALEGVYYMLEINRARKELTLNHSFDLFFNIISMLKQVDGIIIPDDDTKDDAFYVSDSLVSDYEDYAFSVNNSEDDESEADEVMFNCDVFSPMMQHRFLSSIVTYYLPEM
ncbi:hypothetical protein Tco_0362730 [Tanacetum coccineum]